MRFKGLDLNLMVALDVLLETRSVSGAARQMNITQPAMSAALNRLRDYFKDDLLVVHGKRMLPTAHGANLARLIKPILADVHNVVLTSAVFDPATSERRFRIVASDYLTTVLIAPLLAHLEVVAPAVRLELRLPNENAMSRLERGEIDLLLTPDFFISPAHPSTLVFEENHVVVGWKENPIFDVPMDEAAFFSQGHVAVIMGDRPEPAFAERMMEAQGKIRRVEASAPSFTTVPWLVIGTKRLAVMHERLARRLAVDLPLATAPMPFAFPVMREMMQYHRANAADAGLTWLREQITNFAAGLNA